MELYPAIDLRRGRVVRLAQGDDARPTDYDDDPLAVAERFLAAGARWLHVVDLDAAFGDGDQLATIARLAEAGLAVIVSGGVASLDHLIAVRDAGLEGAVVGRALYEGSFSLDDALAATG